jgi:RNA polymerase sigma-70 factor (ECF subfamily)
MPTEIRKTDSKLVVDSERLKSLSNESLIARARAKDTAAFAELMGRHQKMMYQLAMRFVHQSHDAQEILQEVFLATWRKLPTYEGRSEFISWLYRVTYNASLMFLRTRHRHPEVAIEDLLSTKFSQVITQASHGPDRRKNPDEEILTKELRCELQKAIEGLPVILRTVFLVREIDGLSTARAAQSLGLTQPVLKTRLFRARRTLRENMANYLVA